jgi:hypothetical protein
MIVEQDEGWFIPTKNLCERDATVRAELVAVNSTNLVQ